MLSGAVISISALHAKPSHFVIARFARLFPSFILIVPIAVIVARFLSGSGGRDYASRAGLRELIFSLNLSNWSFSVPQPAEGATWTLWVEVRFYFLIYILLGLLAIAKRTLDVRFLLVFGYTWYAFGTLTFASNNVFLSTLLVADYCSYFIVGMSIAIISLHSDYRKSTYPLLFFASISSIHTLQNRLSGLSDLIGISIFFAAAIFIAFGFKFRPRNRSIKSLFMIGGSLSYPVYLAHDRIGGALLAYLDLHSKNHFINMIFAGIFLCAILLIWAYKYEPRISKYLTATLKSEWK